MHKHKTGKQVVSLALSILLCLTAPGVPTLAEDSVTVIPVESTDTPTGSQTIPTVIPEETPVQTPVLTPAPTQEPVQTVTPTVTPETTPEARQDAVTIRTASIKKTWGSAPFDLSGALAIDSRYAGTISYEADKKGQTVDGKEVKGTDIADVSASGRITLKACGSLRIHVTVPEDTLFNAQSLTLDLNVVPIHLGTLTAASFTWSPLSKVYDGTDAIRAEGTLEDRSSMLGTDTVRVSAVLHADSAARGQHATTLSDVQLTVPEGYTCQTDWTAGPEVEILAKEGHLTAQALEMTYGDSPADLSGLLNGPDEKGAYSWVVSKGTDIVSVSGDGRVTALKAGTASITAVRYVSDAYDRMTVDIPVTVHKCTLQVAPGTITWKQADRVWDGQTSISLAGTIIAPDGRTLDLTAAANADDAAVGTHGTTLKGVSCEDDRYLVTVTGTEGPSVRILPRSLSGEDRRADMTYGTPDLDVCSLLALPDDYTGQPSCTIQSGADTVTVHDPHMLAVKKAGTAVVRVDLPADETYAEQFVIVTVTVREKEISLSSEMVSWNEAEKTWDGQGTLSVSGTVTHDTCPDIAEGDTLSVRAEAHADSAAVGTHTTSLSDIKIEGADNRYKVSADMKEGPAMTILSRRLPVQDQDVMMSYGEHGRSVLQALSMPSDYRGTPVIAVQSGLDIVTLEHDGTLTARKAGVSVIRVTLPSDDTYADRTATVTVTVKEKAIRLESGMVEWNKADKTWDGKETLPVSGTVTSETCPEIMEGDTLSVTAKARADSAAVGTHHTTLSDIAIEGTAGKYAITPVLTAGPELSIKARSLTVEPRPIQMTYGDQDVPVRDAFTLPDDYTGVPVYTLKEDSDAVSLSGGHLWATGTGRAVVTVSCPPDATYTGCTLEVSVASGKKSITIDMGKAAWAGAQKVYDGTPERVVAGRFDSESGIGLVGTDVVTVTAEDVADSADIGTHSAQLRHIRVQCPDLYEYTTTGTSGPDLTITPKTIELSARPVTVMYGKEAWERICAGKLPSGMTAEDTSVITTDLTDTDRAELSRIDLNRHVAVSIQQRTYRTGTADNALSIRVTEKAEGNYQFAVASPSAAVVVTNEQISADALWNMLSLDPSRSRRAYAADGTVYLAAGGEAVFRVTGTDRYDTVRIRETAPAQAAVESDTISVPADAVSGQVDGTFYLTADTSRSETDGGDAAIPNGCVMVDAASPDVSISPEVGLARVEQNGNKKENRIYSMPVQTDGPYKMVIHASDHGSGMTAFRYQIVKVRSLSDLSAVASAFRTASGWDACPADGTLTIGREEGDYVVALYAEDKVGNTTCAISNVIAVDHTAPSVSLEGLDEGRAYGKNAAYTISLSDPLSKDSGTAAGLASVTVSVRKDGQSVSGDVDSHTDSFTMDLTREAERHPEDPFLDASSLAHADGPLTLECHLDADKLNSNQVAVSVSVTDRAGHTASTVRHIRFDTTVPHLEAELDGMARNGHYFAADRRMTLTVTERNFVEENLSVLVNGTPLSLSAIRAAGKSGKNGVYLLSDLSDSQADTAVPNRTDARTIRYVLGFGGNGEPVDADYTLQVRMTDEAGNRAETDFGRSAAPTEFTVDEIAPVLTVAFKTQDGQVIDASQNVKKPAYSQVPVIPVLSVKERNFAPSGMKLSMTSKDSRGRDVNGYDQDALKAPGSGQWSVDGLTHSFVMAAAVRDANDVLAGSYTDLAGNTAVYEPHAFTVDQTAPQGTILMTTGKGLHLETAIAAGKTLSLPYGYFDSSSLTFSVGGTDDTSGIASVQYALVDGTAADLPTVRAERDALTWKDVQSDIRISSDRMGLLLARVVDRAGHVSYFTTRSGWIVDTRKPETPTAVVEGTRKAVYRDDVPVTISARDLAAAGVLSGLRSLSYEVWNGTTGKMTQHGAFTADQPGTSSLSGRIVLDAAKNNSNHVTLRLTAEDYAGNRSSREEVYAIDTTRPVLSAAWDRTSMKNGIYTNQTRGLTLRLKERNPDLNETVLSMTINGTAHNWNLNELKKGSAAGYGLTVRRVSDSEAGRDVRNRTDSSVLTFEVAFGEGRQADFEYRGIRVDASDTAGNRNQLQLQAGALTVDKVAPVIRVSYRDGGDVTGRIGTSRNGDYATKGQVTPRITITERHFRSAEVQASLTQTNASGRAVSAYHGTDAVSRASAWSSSGSTHTCSMPVFTGDANYGLSIRYADLAGNEARVYPVHYFTVDHTAPTGSIRVEGTTYTDLRTAVRFAFIRGTSIQAVQSAADATSGIASVSLYRYVPSVQASGSFHGLSTDTLARVGWSSWNGAAVVSPDSQAVLYAKIVDRAGNVTYINTDCLLADHTSPARPVITLGGHASAKGIYNTDVPVRIHAEDQVSGQTYAGLASVKVEVLNGQTVTQTENHPVGGKGARIRSWNGNLTVQALRNNSNNIRIRVTVTDEAGNHSEAEQALKMDTSKPVLSVTYDQNHPENGHYYKTVRTATVTVHERNFDPSGVSWSIQGTSGTRPEIGSWKVSSQGVSDQAVSQCTVTFAKDADYTFTLSVTDAAGNKAELGRTDTFTIDRTAPSLHLSFQPEKGEGKYYRTARTVTVTVKEHNFDPSGLEAEITAVRNGKTVRVPGIGSWRGRGDEHTASVTLQQDGNYHVSFRMRDLAGNRSGEAAEADFVIDTTSPSVTVKGVRAHTSYKGSVRPSVTFRDDNFDKKRIRVTLKGTYHKKAEADGIWLGNAHGGTFTLNAFPRKASADDVYTLTAEMTDRAGNRTVRNVVFSVNRFGSTYEMDNATKAFLSDYAHKEPVDLVIREVNVDGLTSQNVTLMKDGTTIPVAEGAWTVQDESSKTGWKEYVYTIHASALEQEGAYEIRLSSKDRAGNVQDTSAKGVPIRFQIDRTAPSAVLTGIEDRGVYNANGRPVTIVLSDNLSVASAIVSLNGREKIRYSADDIARTDGRMTVYIGAEDYWQTIKVTATDTAGNPSRAAVCHVLITPSRWIRFLNSREARYAGMAAAAAAVLATLLVLRKKKTKKQGGRKEKEQKRRRGMRR